MLAGILSILPNRVRTGLARAARTGLARAARTGLARAAIAGVEQRTPPDEAAGDLRCAIVERFSR